jgi:hypothetical protein
VSDPRNDPNERVAPGQAAAGRVTHELDRIERAVEAGDSDLRALGFWRAVAPVRSDPALADRVADRAGRIDRRAFEARVRPRFPVWLGNMALLAVVAVGAAAIVVAVRVGDPVAAGIALLVAAGAWSLGVHDLAHWLVGSIVGIRYIAYFIGGPPPPRPGLKTDYATYLRTSPARRAWMHASGAIATKLAPFIALALYPLTNAPAWSALALLALGCFQIATDVAFSTKTSDWKRFRREMAAARATGA